MKKVLLGLALVAILAIAAGAFYLYYQKSEEQHSRDEAEAAQVVSQITQTIESTLQQNTPVSWVYDAEDTLLFAIRVSDEASATQVVPEAIATALRSKYPEGFAMRIVRDTMVERSLADKSDYFVEKCVSGLEAAFDENDLMRYLTTIAVYGDVNGLENAAVEYFTRETGKLNSDQAGFLAYAYNNPGASTTEYLTQAGKTAEQLDFTRSNVRNAALESLLRNEVQKLPEVQMGTTSYTVRLSLAAAQQQAMQANIDTAMRQYIDLSSNGSYVLNASVAVLDNATGLITAYIPGRTSAAQNPQEFQMNIATWSDNFLALISRIAQPGQTQYSLQTVKLPNGDTTFVGTGQQWDNQTLSTGVASSGTAIDVLQKIKVMVLSSSPSLIQQVKDLTGEVVYSAPGPEIQPANNKTVLKLRQCFVEDGVESATTLSSQLQLSSGVVCFEMTRDYTVVVLLGSGVIGGDVSSDTRATLVDVASSIITDVRAFFPTPKTMMYARTAEMADEFTATYDANYTLLEEGLGEKFEKLEAMVIDSSATRRTFETEYERLSAELNSLESFVSKRDYTWLVEDLYEIRQGKAEDILKYSV